MRKARDKLKSEIVNVLEANKSMTIREISKALEKSHSYVSHVINEMWQDNQVGKTYNKSSAWKLVYHPIKKDKYNKKLRR